MNHVSATSQRTQSQPLHLCEIQVFFFSENGTENTHFSLQVGRFDKLPDKSEHWKELLVELQ